MRAAICSRSAAAMRGAAASIIARTWLRDGETNTIARADRIQITSATRAASTQSSIGSGMIGLRIVCPFQDRDAPSQFGHQVRVPPAVRRLLCELVVLLGVAEEPGELLLGPDSAAFHLVAAPLVRRHGQRMPGVLPGQPRDVTAEPGNLRIA